MSHPVRDPLAGSSWSRDSTVAGFASGNPNQTLMAFAQAELLRTPGLAKQARHAPLVLDIGCGAGRNAVPIAALGWDVLGTDLSLPMLVAAAERAQGRGRPAGRPCDLVLAPMESLPVASASCDLVIAHGIWNLARSGDQFRMSVREAARVARPGAGLFVFTFSRNTFDAGVQPVAGESFVFTQFSGEPQCFLTQEQLVHELATAGFAVDPAVPLHELNRRAPGMLFAGGPPVIWEGTFRRL